MKNFTVCVIIIIALISSSAEFSSAQQLPKTEKLTLKNISGKISAADNNSGINLRLNSGKSNQFASSYVKSLSGINNNILSKSFDSKDSPKDKYIPLSQLSTGQLNKKVDISNYFPPDYKPWESSRHFGLAVGEGVLFNIFIPWAMARYLRTWDSTSEERWPFIGFQSIWSNLNQGWNYDGDNFLTNLFSHPYGGNLFYNSGRSNGYNFWESSAFALAGSYIWETFMETNQPAINDWVNTGMNGAAFGEILYRLSTMITDNTARGSHRVWTEIAGGLVNPVRLFTRLVNGEISRVFPNPAWRKPKEFELTLDAGTRVLLEEDSVHNAGPKELDGIFEMIIKYGDPYQLNHTTPFSHFVYNIAIASSSPNLTSMNAVGSLMAFQISDKENVKHTLETTLNYNYINNPGFLYGAASVVEQLNSYWTVNKTFDIQTRAGIRFIPMGGTPNDYFYDSVDGRSYDFGQGLGAQASLSLFNNDTWEVFNIQYSMNYIWTQSEPAYSKHFLQEGSVNLQIPLKDYFVFGIGAGYYKRKSYYFYPEDYFGYNVPGQPETNAPDVTYQTPILRVFFKTRIL